ncbi:hypothetical protein BDV93DRAFT_601833 [Ceratobasidium sp. AG-I]|nr:hypothetical protein BDV93DRAFT_601833 [Ceratobasidium sp. AG-I]
MDYRWHGVWQSATSPPNVQLPSTANPTPTHPDTKQARTVSNAIPWVFGRLRLNDALTSETVNENPAPNAKTQHFYVDGSKAYGEELTKTKIYKPDVIMRFAILLSPILSVFLIQSKKLLQQDPVEATVDDTLLSVSQYLQRTEQGLNSSSAPIKLPSFPAALLARWINGLWSTASTALTISLNTVLIAMLVERLSTASMIPRPRPAQSRILWLLVDILSRMLHLALLLLSLGSGLYLWSFNSVTAADMAAVTRITILFYVATAFTVIYEPHPFVARISKYIHGALKAYVIEYTTPPMAECPQINGDHRSISTNASKNDKGPVRTLGVVGGANTEAAAVAIGRQRSLRILECPERHTSIDDRSPVNSALATHLKQVAYDLDFASSPKSMDQIDSSDGTSLEKATQCRRQLAAKWEELVNKAGNPPRLEAPLRPEKTSEFVSFARCGPVVVINMHESRCDALVIQPGFTKISHIPLRFSSKQAAACRALMSYVGPNVGRPPAQYSQIPNQNLQQACAWTQNQARPGIQVQISPRSHDVLAQPTSLVSDPEDDPLLLNGGASGLSRSPAGRPTGYVRSSPPPPPTPPPPTYQA